MKRVPIGGFSVSSKSHEPFLASVSFKEIFFPYFHASIHVWTSGGNSYCKGCLVWSMIMIHKEPNMPFLNTFGKDEFECTFEVLFFIKMQVFGACQYADGV
jgi:hypothetical protein